LDSTAPQESLKLRARATRLITIPSSEQLPERAHQRMEESQDWYSADLYDQETTAEAPPLNVERNRIPESRVPNPEVTYSASGGKNAPTLTILSGYGEAETPSESRSWHGVILGFLLLAFVSALGIGAWYWWSQGGSVTQTSQPSNSNPGPMNQNPSTAPLFQPTSTMTPQKATITSTPDAEINRLREWRIGAKPSEGVEIISALEQAEEKYPTDYRFPYELSKLSIKGITSHHEAFEPLARAAQKAIDNGQTDEMLNSLMADKDEDFYKLSHGHREWKALEEALRNKDKGVLKASIH
jgi:hypothetical protein